MDPYPEDVEQKMEQFADWLSEKDRRRYAAVEALKLGHGGIEYIAYLLGCTADGHGRVVTSTARIMRYVSRVVAATVVKQAGASSHKSAPRPALGIALSAIPDRWAAS